MAKRQAVAKTKRVPRMDAAPGEVTARAFNADSWGSVLTGIGNAMKDKSMSATFQGEAMTPAQGEELRRGDDVAARVIEAVPSEMTRQGFELVIENDTGGLAEEVMAAIDELDVLGTLHEAMCVARATGGAGVLLGAEDAFSRNHPDLPLDPARVKRFDWMTTFNREELKPRSYYTAATSRDYGRPETYEVIEQSFGTGGKGKIILASDRPVVHATRLLRFDGVPVPRRYARETNGWGDSVLLRCAKVIRDYQMSWSGAAILLQEFAQTVFKLEDLAEMVSGDEDGTVEKRAQLIALSRSIANAVLIDKNESFERVTTPLGGLAEMLNAFGYRLCTGAETPAIILLGQSPSGLNSTGAGDLRWWYDKIKVQQARVLRPALNWVIRCIFGALGAKEPANWIVKFPSLWQPTELEQAQLRKTQAETDQIYIATQVVLPEEVAISRFGGDDYDTKTTIDVALRERIGRETDETPDDVEAIDPTKPGAAGEPDAAPDDEEAVDPTTALNGAQVSSLLEIVTAVATGQLPRATGVAIINAAFPIDLSAADRLMGTVGESFTITPAAAPAPFGGGRPGASSVVEAPPPKPDADATQEKE